MKNLYDWIQLYGVNGSYLDVAGSDAGNNFPSSIQVVEGQDFQTAETQLLQQFTSAHPDLALATEYQTTRILPYAFYSWEGNSHLTNSAKAGTRINHPLRTALIGSYCWSREENMSDIVGSALIGALPQLYLSGDYDDAETNLISADKVAWSQARAKLFTEEDLFNDLPSTWDPNALAYYRGKNGEWFAFRKMPDGSYAYVQMTSDGGYSIRLSTENTSDTVPPSVSITSPANGAAVSGVVTISVSASDNVGVSSVSLSVDGAAIGSSAGPQASFSWDASAASQGSHALTAKATDVSGNASTTQVNVIVGDATPPSVSITSPASGSKIASGLVTVLASASDNVGVSRVELYVDGKTWPVSLSQKAPFTNYWDSRNAASGSHTLQCVAFDAAGNRASSQIVTLTK
jgi:hypothetical protein